MLSSDIAQMYRQIKIERSQQDLQRIVWRKDASEPIKHYRLTTVTYGTASAPFLATRALRQIGEENREKFPSTSAAIIEDFYVDDAQTGEDTIEKALQRKKELIQLLEPAGFHLRKWASNISEIVSAQQDTSTEKKLIGIKIQRYLDYYGISQSIN